MRFRGTQACAAVGSSFVTRYAATPAGDLALQSGVELRFFTDSSTGQPHIYGDRVTHLASRCSLVSEWRTHVN